MSKTGRDWHAVRLPGGYGRWGVYRILMVEDDEAEAENLRACISRYSVERDVELRVTWLRTAVGITRGESRYDLIFMDIGLPGINGMEAAALLRTYDKRTPLIFVTNLAQYAVRGYEVDALDFVLKPVTYYNFRMRMDKALRVMRRSTGANVTITTRDGMRVVRWPTWWPWRCATTTSPTSSHGRRSPWGSVAPWAVPRRPSLPASSCVSRTAAS